jgi:hypothetical protein
LSNEPTNTPLWMDVAWNGCKSEVNFIHWPQKWENRGGAYSWVARHPGHTSSNKGCKNLWETTQQLNRTDNRLMAFDGPSSKVCRNCSNRPFGPWVGSHLRASPARLCTCIKESYKYDLTAARAFPFAHHNDWSRWFAISSPPTYFPVSVSVRMCEVAKM